MFHVLIEEMLSPTAFASEWTYLGLLNACRLLLVYNFSKLSTINDYLIPKFASNKHLFISFYSFLKLFIITKFFRLKSFSEELSSSLIKT